MSKKVLYYLNQFFSQIGGEDQAGIAPLFKEESVGPATAFAKGIKRSWRVCRNLDLWR